MDDRAPPDSLLPPFRPSSSEALAGKRAQMWLARRQTVAERCLSSA